MSAQGGTAGPTYAARIRLKFTGTPRERRSFAHTLRSRHLHLKQATPPAAGSLILVELTMPDGRVACRVAGRVVARPGQPGMHLEIVQLDKAAKALASEAAPAAAPTPAPAPAPTPAPRNEISPRQASRDFRVHEAAEAAANDPPPPTRPAVSAVRTLANAARSPTPRPDMANPGPTPNAVQARAPEGRRGPTRPAVSHSRGVARPGRVERLSARVQAQQEAAGPVIGIDLGTTNSCIAVVENGRPHVLSSKEGYQTIPSVVFVGEDRQISVGHKAAQKMLLQPERAIYGSKRFIGRPFTSGEIKNYGHFFRYGLVADARGMAAATIGDRVVPLEAVAGLILRTARQTASDTLGQPVTRCVITVPAYFGESQRRAVIQAGNMAGLVVERVLSEPTAAAVAYGYGRGLNKHVLVYDLGGGTFDTSVLRIAGDEMEVLATDGEPFLGGSDFDDRLIEYLAHLIHRAEGVNIRDEPVPMQRLRDAAEVAKRDLSVQSSAIIDLRHIAIGERGPINFRYEIEREEFERITQDLVQRTIAVVDGVLREAGLKARDVDDIIMAGGQSRSPNIHRLLSERFGKKPSMRVHPDHAVAIGAALVAAAADGAASLSLTDILPASIQLKAGDRFGVVLRRGARLPARTKFELEPSVDADAEYACTLYRGEHASLADNELLGTVRLPSSLAEAVEGATATVVVDVSADGILTLAIRHPVTREVNSLQLSLTESGTTTDDIDDFDITVDEE